MLFSLIHRFIHVLPGAYSAYRWEALKKQDDSNILDEQYLVSVLYKDFTKRKGYNIQVYISFIYLSLYLNIYRKRICS